jgi:hypothetical protein
MQQMFVLFVVYSIYSFKHNCCVAAATAVWELVMYRERECQVESLPENAIIVSKNPTILCKNNYITLWINIPLRDNFQ